MKFFDKECAKGHKFKTTDESVNFCPTCDPGEFIDWTEGYYSPKSDFGIQRGFQTKTKIVRKRWPFLFIRQGEIEILKLCGLPIYKRVGIIRWCLGFIWEDR